MLTVKHNINSSVILSYDIEKAFDSVTHMALAQEASGAGPGPPAGKAASDMVRGAVLALFFSFSLGLHYGRVG